MKSAGYLILCRASEYREPKSQAEAKLFVQLKTAALRGSK